MGADKLINSLNMKHCVMNAVKGIIITSRACVILLKLLKGRLSGIADVSQGELSRPINGHSYLFYGHLPPISMGPGTARVLSRQPARGLFEICRRSGLDMPHAACNLPFCPPGVEIRFISPSVLVITYT